MVKELDLDPTDSVDVTRRKLLGAGVAMSTAFIAGCVEDDDPLEDDPVGDDDPDPDPERLHFTQQVAPIEWDPVVLNDAYSTQITQTIYDGLYEVEPQTFNVQPKLATDAPEIEEDGTRFIVELRDDVEFHNGDALTAEDVVHTFLAPIEEETDNAPDVDMIESAEEIDEHTVQFDLEFPYGPFETIVLPSHIVNASARQDDREAYNTTNPVGSGPYRFVDAEIGEFVDVELWDDYWDEPSQVAEIRYEPAEDDAGRVSRMLARDTDVMEGIPPADWDDIEAEDGISINSVQSTGVLYMAFNTVEGPTADVDVRRGIAHCHSTGAFVEDVLGDQATDINIPVAEGVAEEFGIDLQKYEDMRYEFDPDLAKDLLDGSDAITEDDTINIIVPPDDLRQQWGELIADRLIEIEYDATVERLDWDVLTDRYTSGDADEFNMYALGWTGGADPDVYIYQLFHEDNAGITQGHMYDNPDFHQKITDARQSVDMDERGELYDEIFEEIIDQVIWIPGWNPVNGVAYLDEEVDGVLASTTTSFNPHLDYPGLQML